MRIHHVGYLVEDIDKAFGEFSVLGYEPDGAKCTDEKRNIIILFLKNGTYRIELVAPLNDTSPVKSLLKKIGSAPYHFCYETMNLLDKIGELKKQGYIVIAEALEAPAIENKRVAFLFKNTIGMIELVEM